MCGNNKYKLTYSKMNGEISDKQFGSMKKQFLWLQNIQGYRTFKLICSKLKIKTTVGSGFLASLFYEDPPILPITPSFSNFAQPSSFHNLYPYLYFCCLVSLAEWVIALHLTLFYLMVLWINKSRALPT